MILNQKMYDKNGVQVALFPLESFIITQRDDESYSHDPSKYYATDYQAFHYNTGSDTELGTGYVLTRHEYYAPVDMVCAGIDTTNASILWRSINKVHLANDTIDYLLILFYHDNDVHSGAFSIGDTRQQGQVIGHTGTYGDSGSSVADHVHIETGFGENWSRVYANPSWGHINKEYGLHNYDACFGNDTTCYGIASYPSKYPWKMFSGSGKSKNFPWYLIARKRRNDLLNN